MRTVELSVGGLKFCIYYFILWVAPEP